MATLCNGDLSFEFVFKELDASLWVQYEIYFRWQGKPVFRNDILKRTPPGWSEWPMGALRANDAEIDTFVPTLQAAINAVKPAVWSPVEPDIMIAFYPNRCFPFVPVDADEGPKEPLWIREPDDRRLPDDIITMIAFTDAYNFKGCSPYYGSGFAMILTPTRKELSLFYESVKQEYDAFAIRERLVERNAEYNAQAERNVAEWRSMHLN